MAKSEADLEFLVKKLTFVSLPFFVFWFSSLLNR